MQPMRDIGNLRFQARRVTREWLDMIDRAFRHEIQQQGLDDMVRLTGSQVGFLYTINGPEGTIGLRNVSVANRAPLPLVHGPGKSLNLDGFWKACLVSREPVIRNHAVDLVPPRVEDLGPIARDLTVPIFADGDIIAVAGVGNSRRNYDRTDAELLQEMAADLWRVVIRKRLHDAMSDDVK